MRQYKGLVTIGNVAYFDCPEPTVTFIEAEIKRLWKPAIDITRHDEGTHDRGFRYVTYQVTSRRYFDPDVELIADYLDTLAHHAFADLRGQDASRWPVKTLERGAAT